MKKLICAALCMALALTASCALAYDAQAAQSWLAAFAEALGGMTPLNDPLETADPARAGEYLLEYPFGTVLSGVAQAPDASQIIEVDVSTPQVTDCRGVRVGMPLSAALEGTPVTSSQTSLAVLSTQDAGLGWSWAYIGEAGIYGVEYISYGGEGLDMREYTLTYVIDGQQTIEGIRVRVAEATQAQAEEGMRTAEEIASRQEGEALALANDEEPLREEDLLVMGAAKLGTPVAGFVAAMGEPVEVQVLPGAKGRLLLYEGAALTLTFDEYTGEELVTGVSVSGTGLTGPRGLTVGESVQEVAALFRCDANVGAAGGTLYLEGEAEGEAPYGELVAQADGSQVLRYACALSTGETALLEIGIEEEIAVYWQMHLGEGEAQDDA